ncbi:hypothetical protein DMA12_34010 [Amycolatopsis balhimycina DSM 5908]|uniref:Uncharacterized protein n=1 Tax=Amycolatopsis balhimycina DSM 5908 TaxID=1081091 RepID=A0A428W4S2_AMYBA|nr:hypothetical protein [Amycolatopsis balhimycina]RSM38102.1 hypothetical protein DMA12_34010 [Amycolatopsis balhimycina DSM 5908]
MPDSTAPGPVHRVHTSCDVEKYSTFLHEDQHFVQSQLNTVLARAARAARVDRENAILQPAGDGDLTRWPETVTSPDVLADYVPAVYRELLNLNRNLAADRQIRLRLAITAGISEEGDYGLVGAAPVHAARLVNSRVGRNELANAQGHPMVVIVDDPVYQDVVRRGVRHLDARAYRRAIVTDAEKPSYERVAWIMVPGRSMPAPEPPSTWSKQVRTAIVATGAAVAALVIAMVISTAGNSVNSAGWPSSTQPQPPTHSPSWPLTTTPRLGSGRISRPVESALVSKCVRVEGVGHPTSGYEFRIAASTIDGRIWVTRQTKAARATGYDWYAWALYVGADEDFGAEFYIRVYEVPERKLAHYDEKSFRETAHSQATLDNDGLRLVHSVHVKRRDVADNSCSSQDDGVTIP